MPLKVILLPLKVVNFFGLCSLKSQHGCHRPQAAIMILSLTYPGRLGAQYTGLGTQTLVPKKGFLTFYLKIFFKHPWRSVSLFNLCNLEKVLQRNLRTGTARVCIFRASGGTRFFRQPWWQKGGTGTPRCSQSAQKNSGYVTDYTQSSSTKLTLVMLPRMGSISSFSHVVQKILLNNYKKQFWKHRQKLGCFRKKKKKKQGGLKVEDILYFFENSPVFSYVFYFI